jgi:hypothetical protein
MNFEKKCGLILVIRSIDGNPDMALAYKVFQKPFVK